MNDTERLVVLVEHLAGALDVVAHAMRAQLGPANADRILEHTRAATHEARVIAANSEDHS